MLRKSIGPMRDGVNKICLIGNVGGDPEIRQFGVENTKCSFSLATSRTYTPEGGDKVTKTEWHNVVAWGKTAEIAEKYLSKGSQVYIEGSIATRSYEDSQKNKKYITEVVTQKMLIFDGRSESQKSLNTPPQEKDENQQAGEVDFDDELPF